ncbi:reverse transcriptase domain-containing protein, partial [Klebsiella pneumoniae]|uniref:reverse transcriptase domain-containing protein n=1 Tax=Klebsiella pneumoniae TaxID=573 RepID=UPI003EBF20F5
MNVGLRQGCVMSPWLFNIFMDGVVREVDARMLGRGLRLKNADGREWSLNQLLFADDTALVADSEETLRQLVEEFGRVCDRRKLKVNENKSKVMRCTRSVDGRRMNIVLNDELLEEVDCFKYLGSHVAVDE